MEVQMRTPLKRPLSFSDDSVEWDKIRDKIPADVGWNSLKSKSGSDDNVSVNVKGPPVDWTPYGYVSGRKAKKQRLDRVAAALSVKRTSTCTVDKLEDAGEREVAEQIALSVSKYCGSFVFESSDNEKFARLVPFPNSHASTKMPANDDWQLDKFDCKLETLMSKSPSSKVRSISFPPWKGAKRRERKYEVTNIKREVKLEDIIVEDGAFSWSTFANIVKPQLAAMEPKARCAAAKQFSALLQADPSAAT
uniref:Uncharacterized protein n=2 Tax=Haemonchus contortus TaxID=6289 RepID=A0A7I5EAP5_HAECO